MRQDPEKVEIRRETAVDNPRVFLEEASVTATENALILFAGLGGGTVENPAREPHVQSLIEFLRLLGCSIEVDTLAIQIRSGVGRPATQKFVVPGDYVDAGTLAIAAAVTGGDVVISGITGRRAAGHLPGAGPVWNSPHAGPGLGLDSRCRTARFASTDHRRDLAGFSDRPDQPGHRPRYPIGGTLPDPRLDV